MSSGVPLRLGEVLIDNNQILPEQLDEALEKQRQSGRRLGQVLIDMGLLTFDELSEALTKQTGIPHIWLRKGLVDPHVVGLVPRQKAETYCVMPMFKVHNTLSLAMADCGALFILDDIQSMTGCNVQPVQCRRADIQTAIEEHYAGGVQIDDLLDTFKESDVQVVDARYQDLALVEEVAEGAKIINLVNIILLNAIKERASDIHIEPDGNISRVRCRVDGALREVMNPRIDLHPAIVSRVKVMAKMDIAERRLPQDGRIHIRAEDHEVDVRVSSIPTVVGEKIVMRILDKTTLVLDLDQAGFHEATLAQMKRLLQRPNGILLVTGPTGSGKTTTLYSGLSFISSVERNLITIEDPVEYELPLVNQVQVNEEQGLTFARTLRSILRQDPDVVMVGEIRARETAEVAIQAALTGHLVLSTLHTNESAATICRLLEMGIEPYLLASAVIGIVAQRLVRLVCSDCRTTYTPPETLLEQIGWTGRSHALVRGKGCERCFGTGLRGRAGIFELLIMDDPLRDTILDNPSIQSIRGHCARTGIRMLKDEAFRLVEEGRTSLEEVLRVVVVEETSEPVPSMAGVKG